MTFPGPVTKKICSSWRNKLKTISCHIMEHMLRPIFQDTLQKQTSHLKLKGQHRSAMKFQTASFPIP
uniref:Uncharacterized protein n=1 Tax=Arundo donax TaxID=35708 RepID=A0A0A9BJA6_ARUDO